MVQQFKQWVATAAEVIAAIGGTPRVGAQTYLQPSSQGPAEFFIVEKVRGPGVGSGYEVLDVRADVVTEQQIRNFLTNKGETLPANLRVFVRSSTPGGLVLDEIVVVDDSSTITRL